MYILITNYINYVKGKLKTPQCNYAQKRKLKADVHYGTVKENPSLM